MNDLPLYREGQYLKTFSSSIKRTFGSTIQTTYFKIPKGHIKFYLYLSPNYVLYSNFTIYCHIGQIKQQKIIKR